MKKAISLLLVLLMVLSLCACDFNSGKNLFEDTETDSVEFFHGTWKYEDSDRYIVINEDNTWEYRNAEMYILLEGNYSLKDDTLVLKSEDNSTAFKLKQDGSKWLIDDEGMTLARYEWDDSGDEEADIRPFLGVWKYDDCNLLIGINADGTWTMYDMDDGDETHGFCHMQDIELVMEDENGHRVGSMNLGSDDRIYDNEGGALSPYVETDTPPEYGKDDYTPWFTDNDLLVNYNLGDPSKTVIGGVSVRGEDTYSYTRIPADWFVEQTSYQSTGDGNCLITLTATSLSDGSTMPAFVNKERYVLTWTWSLCDYYSGVILTEAEDDTFYSYTYDSNGESVHVEFSYSHEVIKYKDLSYELKLTLTVRMPENYDGLVLVCYNTPESYEVKLQRDLVYEGQTVLPVDELPGWREMGSGLICRIND